MYADPEKQRQWSRNWYIKNRERVLERSKRYETVNRERRRAQKKIYVQRPDVKKRVAQASIAYYHQNSDYRSRQLQLTRERRALWRKKIFQLLGGEQCSSCGFDDYRALQIDHKNGGGRREFQNNPHLIKPSQYFAHIEKNPTAYQILCANCNWIKRFECNEIPKPGNKLCVTEA